MTSASKRNFHFDLWPRIAGSSCGKNGSVTKPWQAYFNEEQTPQRSAAAVCKHFMNDILNKTIVLVLNRNWQAINIRTPQDAFCQMAPSGERPED
jgi:hypothetical protein